MLRIRLRTRASMLPVGASHRKGEWEVVKIFLTFPHYIAARNKSLSALHHCVAARNKSLSVLRHCIAARNKSPSVLRHCVAARNKSLFVLRHCVAARKKLFPLCVTARDKNIISFYQELVKRELVKRERKDYWRSSATEARRSGKVPAAEVADNGHRDIRKA